MAYGIGLDIGIGSVGYATVALNEKDEPSGILRMGCRIFDAAEHPKTGASLAAPRREARSARRRLRRRRHRLERIRSLLISSGFISAEDLAILYNGKLENVYALRTRALDDRISDAELCRVLIHLAQRRGFKSNRKSDASDKEAGKLLSAVSENDRRMQENGYRTVGEMLCKDVLFAEHKRNKAENYLSTVTRAAVEAEARLILDIQQQKGNSKITDSFKGQYLKILLSQRAFDEGPGGNSPYGGNQIEKRIGMCTFEKDKPRAPKASYSFEYFQLLQKVNHIRLLSDAGSEPLTDAQRKAVVKLAHKSPDISFDKIRKELSLPASVRFNTVSYRDSVEEAEKKQKLGCLKAYHEMRKALDKVSKGRLNYITDPQRNEIAYALTVFKTDDKIAERLNAAGLEKQDVEQLLLMKGFSGFGHLSVEACDKIIPFLEQGMNYNDACNAAGYAFRGHEGTDRQTFLPAQTEEMEQITSPVVRRAVSQSIKVINAIIREMNEESPTYVKIELARDMSRDFAERLKIRKENEKNAETNERTMQELHETFGIVNPTGQDLIKYRLYKEQNGVDPYTQESFVLDHLFDAGYADVDHIVPYSISFDDRFCNKVLTFASVNRKEKGNRLPLQFLTGERRERFIVHVKTNVRDYRKQRLLLKEKITEEDRKNFRERNLQDTKTMSRFLYNYINDHLQFAPFRTDRKRHVTAVNGAITSYLRKRWGINKVREDGDLHHAMDALVIACTTDGMIQRLSRYSELHESEYLQTEGGSVRIDPQTGELLEKFPYPWPCFRQEWTARISDDPQTMLRAMNLSDYAGLPVEIIQPIFVSRMPKHKVTGAAHKDTIKSSKELNEGIVIVKRALTDLKLDKDGEIENYYDPNSDRLLYDALKMRLVAFGGNAAKAFEQPFFKPKHNGTPGPLVKKVKLYEKSSLNVPVHGGQAVADNDSMVRIDIFYVENDGYYMVPIYVADTKKPELPNRAVVAGKPYSEWKDMREEDFLFSLYPSDLVKIRHRKGVKLTLANPGSTLEKERLIREGLMYYVKASISTGAMTVETHDRTYEVKSLGIKTLDLLEKYQVDVLGNITKVHKETRQAFQ